MAVKKLFVKDMIDNSHPLSILLEKKTTCYAVLRDSAQISNGSPNLSTYFSAVTNQKCSSAFTARSLETLPPSPAPNDSILACKNEGSCAESLLEMKKKMTYDLTRVGQLPSHYCHSENTVNLANEYFPGVHSEENSLESQSLDGDLHSDDSMHVDLGTLACVACGVWGFPCRAASTTYPNSAHNCNMDFLLEMPIALVSLNWGNIFTEEHCSDSSMTDCIMSNGIKEVSLQSLDHSPRRKATCKTFAAEFVTDIHLRLHVSGIDSSSSESDNVMWMSESSKGHSNLIISSIRKVENVQVSTIGTLDSILDSGIESKAVAKIPEVSNSVIGQSDMNVHLQKELKENNVGIFISVPMPLMDNTAVKTAYCKAQTYNGASSNIQASGVAYVFEENIPNDLAMIRMAIDEEEDTEFGRDSTTQLAIPLGQSLISELSTVLKKEELSQGFAPAQQETLLQTPRKF
eukprot:Gb_28739 [translate_table: standard]